MRAVHMRGSAFAALGVAAILAVAMLTTPTPAGAAGTQTVQVPQPLCTSVPAGHRACDAIRLVTREVSNTKAGQLKADGVARTAGDRLGFGPAGGFTPKQLTTAYGVHPGAHTTQTVAIVDAFDDPSVRSDLNFFDSHYGLRPETSRSLVVLNQAGQAGPLPTPDSGWAGEITLDVQAVRAVCHRCRVLLIEANSDSSHNLATAVNQAVAQRATIVSNSYGGPETDPSNTPANRRAYNHKGVAVLASTGDDGYYDWDNFNFNVASHNAPQVPASYRSVVGVGGTTLYLNPNGTRANEQVWNENGSFDVDGQALASTYGLNPGASGSGCSKRYAAHRWQTKVSGYGSLGCRPNKRNGVDIAAVADEFTGFDTYETFGWCTSSCFTNGWATVGGTSLASPIVAGMWGLAGGPHGVKYPALTLYGHYQSTKHSTFDVTVGGTGACDTASPQACATFFRGNPNQIGAGLIDCAFAATGKATKPDRGQCYAKPGYDGVSGVGAPHGLSVFKPIGPRAVITGTYGTRKAKRHTFSATQSRDPFPGGSITRYLWSWGDGHASTTTHPTATHTYRSKGTKRITLTVTDNYRQTDRVSRLVSVR